MRRELTIKRTRVELDAAKKSGRKPKYTDQRQRRPT